jgi:predicted adenine nucleotide alpha hydrolase (AANH) superfamily ATPase
MAYPLKELVSDGYEPVVYFFNTNIYPENEYNRRLTELENYCAKEGCECVVDEYMPEIWQEYVKGLEKEPEKGRRCERCFELRLEKTAQKALAAGIKNFTTTLTVSPHKNSEKIFEIAGKISEKYGINYIKKNFKKDNGFLETSRIARENNFYRQDYCGCKYSIRGELWNVKKMKTK